MLRRWSFPPSRVLDAMLVIFAINGVLVASSLVARYATADDPPSQSTLVDEAIVDDEQERTSSAADAAVAPDGIATNEPGEVATQPEVSATAPLLSNNQAIDQLPDEIPPPPDVPVPDEAMLESLNQDSQFQEFVEIAADQNPE